MFSALQTNKLQGKINLINVKCFDISKNLKYFFGMKIIECIIRTFLLQPFRESKTKKH